MNNFYRAFEDKYRGSRELIRGRLKVYLPFIKPLLEVYPDAAMLDLGCGRGEWLELLAEEGLRPVGVDLDPDMLEATRDLGLETICGDAIAYLESLPEESQVVVSAFHFVEHITFPQLERLGFEAMRVLKPGGLLILETPNPENILVATQNFYLDPTHDRPIPPNLLSFIIEHLGFTKVKTLRLQEDPALCGKDTIGFREVLAGASPDYAVVAQKGAPERILEKTQIAFERDYGIGLEELLHQADHRLGQLEMLGALSNRLETYTGQVDAYAKTIDEQARQLDERLQQNEALVARLETYTGQVDACAKTIEEQARQLDERLQQNEALVARLETYTGQVDAYAKTIEEQARQLDERLYQNETLTARLTTYVGQLDDYVKYVEERGRQAEAMGVDALTKIARITAPGRAVRHILKGDFSPIDRVIGRIRCSILGEDGARKLRLVATHPVGYGISYLGRHPKVRQWLLPSIRRFPALKQWAIDRRRALPLLKEEFDVEGGLTKREAINNFQTASCPGKRSVDQILESIRAELSLDAGD